MPRIRSLTALLALFAAPLPAAAQRWQPSQETLAAAQSGDPARMVRVLQIELTRCEAATPRADECLTVLMALTNANRLGGNPAAAVETGRRALALALRTISARHPDIGSAYGNLAFALAALGRHAEATDLFRQALVNAESRYPADWTSVQTALANLALSFQNLGAFDEAAAHLNRLLALSRKHGDLAFVVNTHLALGALEMDRGRYPEAETAFREGEELAGRTGNVEQVWRARNGIASALQDQGRVAEALPLFREIHAFCQQRFGEGDSRTQVAASNFALALIADGRREEAEMLQRRALAVAESTRFDRTAQMRALNALGNNLSAQNKFADGEAMLRRAVALARQAASLSELAMVLGNLAINLQRQNNPEGLAHFVEAYTVDRRWALPDHRDRIARTRALADYLRTTGRYRSALPLYREASAGSETRRTRYIRFETLSLAERREQKPIFEGLVEVAWQIAAQRGRAGK